MACTVKNKISTWYNRKTRSLTRKTLHDMREEGLSHEVLRGWLGARPILEMIRERRLRYIGHVARYPDDRLCKTIVWGTNELRRTDITGKGSSIRGQWKEDFRSLGATPDDCQDRDKWKVICSKEDLIPKPKAVHEPREIRQMAQASGRTRAAAATRTQA